MTLRLNLNCYPFILALFLAGTTTLFHRAAAPQAKSAEIENLWTRKKGEDWPRMLGPRYNSHSEEVGIRTAWGKEGLKIIWSARTGTGYGNGVASQGRWFQFDRYGNQERLTCHHAETGEVLWSWEHPVAYADPYGYNNGPRCSPVVDGDRVYVYGVSGNLACLSILDGTPIWRHDVQEMFWVIPNFFGVGASPLVYEDLLWVMVGGSKPDNRSANELTVNDVPAAIPNQCGMVAFDKKTGRVRHRIGNYLASYSAPVIRQIDGRDLCLALMREGLFTFSPKDGSETSFYPWRAEMLESVNGASPILVDNKILIGEAYQKGGTLLEYKQGKLFPLWTDSPSRKDQMIRPHWTNPIAIDDHVYLSSGRNAPDTDFRCVKFTHQSSASQASTEWNVRNRDRMTGIAVDQHLVLLGESGTLQLVNPTSQRFDVLSEMDLADTIEPKSGAPYIRTPSWAPPVLSHGLLYVRGEDRVVCLELIED